MSQKHSLTAGERYPRIACRPPRLDEPLLQVQIDRSEISRIDHAEERLARSSARDVSEDLAQQPGRNPLSAHLRYDCQPGDQPTQDQSPGGWRTSEYRTNQLPSHPSQL